MNLPPPKKKATKGLPPPKEKKFCIHLQDNLLEIESEEKVASYTSKILAPIYKPSAKRPDIFELVDGSKVKKLLAKICNSKVSRDEMAFLVSAAYRHNIFSYKKIADYYAGSSAEMQELMEDSALVIIDFDKAIQNGYIKFTEETEELYKRETAH